MCGLLLLLTLFSCKKDSYEVGIDILPPSDTLGVCYTDTMTVIAYTVLHDSSRTDESSYGMLGAIMDPVFGKTSTTIYSQFLLSTEGVDFGDNPVLDSVILMLYYTGYYGDTNTLQQVKVYELSEDLYTDSSYYSNQTAATYSNLLANQYYKPRPTDSVKIYGKKAAPQLRINLSKRTKYLGNKLLSAPASILGDNEVFVTFFKGLAIESQPVNQKGGFITFSTSSGYSNLILYYHNDDKDSLSYDLTIGDDAARFTRFNHYKYADACPEFRQQVLYGDTALGKDKLFLQAMSGTRIKVQIPYLRSLIKNRKIAISNAQLVFENPDKDTTLSPPEKLSIYKIDSAGNIGLLADYYEGSSYYGGAYKESTRTYPFRITLYLQDILDDETAANPYLYISPIDPLEDVLYCGRVILNGTSPFTPNYRSGKLKLKLTYSKLQ